jgi:hypothetical protein
VPFVLVVNIMGARQCLGRSLLESLESLDSLIYLPVLLGPIGLTFFRPPRPVHHVRYKDGTILPKNPRYNTPAITPHNYYDSHQKYQHIFSSKASYASRRIEGKYMDQVELLLPRMNNQ